MGRLIRGISENGGILFCAADTTDMVHRAEQLHETSAVTTAALGRLLTAGALMGAMLKHESHSLTLRVKGGGPAGVVLAVANGAGSVKGYVQNPVVEELAPRADGKLNVGAAVGRNGTLSVIKDLGLKEPYVGQIPLVSGEIAEDITQYYAVSEQIPTVCALGVLVDKNLRVHCAGGYLVQLLPGACEQEIAALERNIAQMPAVTQMLAQGQTVQDMMEMVLAGFAPDILDESQVRYDCDCSRERMERAMLSLGQQTLQEMAREQETAEICCQFCKSAYVFALNEYCSQG